MIKVRDEIIEEPSEDVIRFKDRLDLTKKLLRISRRRAGNKDSRARVVYEQPYWIRLRR